MAKATQESFRGRIRVQRKSRPWPYGGIVLKTVKTDQLVNLLLSQHNSALAEHFKSDVVTIKSPIRFGLDDIVRHEIEDLHDDNKKRASRLTVLLETTGGYIEIVERIYNIFRKHYAHVDFIVPNYAYSAGTVLVLSGDAIYMDYYSILGPIDPQYETEDGKFVPGLGYLQKFKELTKIVNSATSPSEVRAELSYLLKKFDPATLFLLEQAKSHSESLLEEWLSKHKFHNWTTRERSKKKVKISDRRKRAREIAEILGDPARWHSHGRGIGIKELTSEEIKLKVIDFGEDQELNKKIRNYYDLVLDYCGKLGVRDPSHTVVHSRNGIRSF
jgi:hypothetical protein